MKTIHGAVILWVRRVLAGIAGVGVALLLWFAVLEHVSTGPRRALEASPWWFVLDGIHAPGVLDADKIYALKKNVFLDFVHGTDALGFRLAAHPNAARPHHTVVVVGDSFTYGAGVGQDDAYPAKLEKLFATNNASVVVYNAGVPGYGPDQEYVSLMQILASVKPDLVIWNFFTNDIEDADEACLFAVKNGTLVRFHGWLNTLYIQGVLLRLIPRSLYGTNAARAIASLPATIAGHERFTFGCSGTMSEDARLQKVSLLIDQAEEALRRTGARLLVTLAPYQWYFDRGSGNNSDALRTYTMLRQTLAATSVPFLDTNSALAKRLEPDLFLLREGATKNEPIHPLSSPLSQTMFSGQQASDSGFGWQHLGPYGNTLFAEEVFEAIRTMDVLRIPP